MTGPTMRKTAWASLAAGAALAVAVGAWTTAGAGGTAQRPVVLELFQSQGCSSCPPANANLNAIADRPDVLALSFGVTYWDQLGWKDTFAKPAFTDRQKAYARGLDAQLGTPQMVVEGREDLIGTNARDVELALRRARPAMEATVALSRGRVEIGAGQAPKAGADVWLVRYDPRVRQVAIQRGENNGKTLPHRDVVVELTRLGGWNGAPVGFAARPPADPALRTAVLVQARDGGPILAAARL
ncbi:thioredoxin family protein [Caulobacter sp. UNC279MFTsu5.1]|uniref:DUF1223 domain-containing protein n=1 Tax=Caulobacter sp. UNC279MFTsu5.1 TaxID=1502775 RepID=UPI0008E560D5|nr:DUF1223 domain-containing protein [Caulobacter sp. UNC279MFTsu5.1]SFK26353.1 hypothetical protein SAMN02799626_03836 [Caulobacter sp. UNC279MFTsu5.1]